MAKKPIARRVAGGASGKLPAVQSEAVGKFDKFGAFGLALPAVLLSVIGLIVAIGYTHDQHDVGLFGLIPGTKSVFDWNSGPESVGTLSKAGISISGFQSTNYIAPLEEGEVDVAVLTVGTRHNVHVGDVFTLNGDTPNVRLEFVVFEARERESLAYILLGQDVSSSSKKARKYSMKESDIRKLCGTDIKVKREWKDQLIRRYVEPRTTQQ